MPLLVAHHVDAAGRTAGMELDPLTATKWGRFHGRGEVEVKLYETPAGVTRAAMLAPLIFEDKHGHFHEAPLGFDSDGCSIPRAGWWIYGHPFEIKNLLPALIHDWNRRLWREDQSLTLAQGDRLLYEGLRARGKSAWKARTMHLAVRAAVRFA